MAVYKLSEILTLKRGYDLPYHKFIKGIYPVVYSNGVLNYHKYFKVNEQFGVVTGRSGTIGNVHFINGPYWPHNTTLYVEDFKGNNPKYIFYLLRNLRLDRYKSGTGVPTLNRNHLRDINVNIPSISEQEKIIEIIKPVEKLFLKYSNIVKIDTIENTKKDIQNLIEIIKPLEDVESKLENINNSALEFISSLSNNNMRLSLNDISVSINLRPKNTNQVSAKVMRKRNPLLINIEESNTYKSNSFFTKKGSLLVNTIRPKLNKFCVTPCDLDYNGTSLALQINEHHTAAIKALISDNFWEQCDLLSKGTKMPIISKNDLLNNVKFNAVDIEIPNIYVFFQQLGLLLIKTNALKNSLINLLIK